VVEMTSQSTTLREAGLLFSSGLGSEVKGWWWWKRASSRRPCCAGHHQNEVPVVMGSSGSRRRSKQRAGFLASVAPGAHYDPRTFAREGSHPTPRMLDCISHALLSSLCLLPCSNWQTQMGAAKDAVGGGWPGLGLAWA
jgi:hypothetical protein